MKVEVKVVSLTHEDLVNLFSTALYGCDYLVVDYDEKFYEAIPENNKRGECFEDKIADVLLNGGKIKITDFYAEGDLNEGLVKCWLDGDDGVYEVSLNDILYGCGNGEGYDYAKELLEDEEGDYYTANNLLQIIMFGEVVYG